jgi:DNA-binding Lrp family transcriptional regulator/YHS domain-containing protein
MEKAGVFAMSEEGSEVANSEPLDLDDADLAILAVLSKNARAQLHELSAASNLSIPTARARLLRLTSSLAIRRFVTEVDVQRILGKGLVAFVLIKVRMGLLNGVVESIKKLDEVVEAFLTAGEHDVVIKVFALDLPGFEAFVKGKLAKIDGVDRISSSFVVESLKEEPNPSLSFVMRLSRLPRAGGVSVAAPLESLSIACAACNKGIPLNREPVKAEMEGKEFYFCSRACHDGFMERELDGRAKEGLSALE